MRQVNFHLARNFDVLLNTTNGADDCLGIPMYSKDITVPIPESFSPDMVEKEPVVIWKSEDLRYFHLPQITGTIPTKKRRFKLRLISCNDKTLNW